MSYDWNFLISVDVISWACPIFGNHILYKLVNFHSVQTLLYLPVLCYDVIVLSTHLHYCTNQFDVQWYPLDIYHLEAMTCKIGKKIKLFIYRQCLKRLLLKGTQLYYSYIFWFWGQTSASDNVNSKYINKRRFIW